MTYRDLKEGDQVKVTDENSKLNNKILTIVSTITPYSFAEDFLVRDEQGDEFYVDMSRIQWKYLGQKSTKTNTVIHDEVNFDPVNKPSHYNQGKIEVIDFIDDQKFGYYEGNIIKYICRYRYKNGIQDLEKAAWYLNRLIQKKKKEEGNATPD